MPGNPEKRKPQTTRTFAEKTFTKAMAVRPHFNRSGIETSKKWPSERIMNEAAALRFIRANTTIPVPRVIETGEGGDGTYLTVERVDGIPLDEIRFKCRQRTAHGLPDGHQAKDCDACQAVANRNAATFIEETMIPQLTGLKSHESGFRGSVIPPPWVTEYDRRAEWTPKVAERAIFVFCHGDLGPQNILCDPATLQVSCVVDWENAGFYDEPFLHQWAVDRESYIDMYSNEDQLDGLIQLLEGRRV